MSSTALRTALDTVPLCVDLDRSLIRTDMLWESLLALGRHRPWLLLSLPLSILRGRAHCKRYLSEHVSLDVAVLPYNQPLLSWLRAQKQAGRSMVLCTASDQKTAELIAHHLGLFDQVIGSDGLHNNKAGAKLAQLQKRFGNAFDYVGDSASDLVIWKHCRQSILINPSPGLEKRVRATSNIGEVFREKRPTIALLLREIRIHQWLKNLLLFLPLITAHQASNLHLLSKTALAFLAFNFCASATYIVNDLLDIEADRHHVHKRRRPLASGDLPLPYGLTLLPILLTIAVACMSQTSSSGLCALLSYFLLTVAYSLYFKQKVLIDVFVLAGLYVFRIIAGGIVCQVRISPWLLSFSFLSFLSLAFCKRAAELVKQATAGSRKRGRRGYDLEDLQQVNLFGVVLGFLASLVVALYISGENVHDLYQTPRILWALFPLVLFWMARVWMITARGRMNEDPVLFAIRDSVTWLVISGALLVMYLATLRY